MLAPAVVVLHVAAEVVVPAAVVVARRNAGTVAAEGAAAHHRRAASAVAPRAGGGGQRSAEGVEPEQRIGARHHVHALDGRIGYQVPVDHIAEGLVDTYTVDVDGNALRRAQQRRRREAAVVERRLVGVFLPHVQIHAAHVLAQCLGAAQRLLALYLAAGDGLDVGRHLVQRRADTGHRCGTHHLNLGKIDGLGSDTRRGHQRHHEHNCQHRHMQALLSVHPCSPVPSSYPLGRKIIHSAPADRRATAAMTLRHLPVTR